MRARGAKTVAAEFACITPGPYRERIRERLAARSIPEPTTGCLLWMGAHSPTILYGSVKVLGQTMVAHRVAYMVAHGAIPERWDVAHRCHNKACVNPDHLRAMTHRANKAQDRGRIKAAGGYLDRIGERNWNAKLTADDVRSIRRAAASGTAFESLASRHGVAPATISGIVHRRRWAHLDDAVSAGGAR